jgi:two-component system nitrate/nitrite response regulator NarL
VRVLIVDDHKLFAEVIRAALHGNGIDTLPVATTAADGLEAARANQPDLVLLDLGLPDADGVSISEKILQACPDTRVVALTGLNDDRFVKDVMRAGFHGYISKDTDVRDFVESVREVMKGEGFVTRRGQLVASETKRNPNGNAELLARQLTDRERLVLTFLVEGASSEQMAARLGISPNTVRTHVQNVLTKLQVHSRLEAATFAVRNGLVPGRSEVGDGNGRRKRSS